MKTSLDLAHELVEDVRAALDAAGLEDVHATLDAGEIPSAARAGVVCVSAPTITFESWSEPAMAFELNAVAGPADNYLAAWARLDLILNALHAGQLNLKRAEPGGFAQLNGPVLPAYTITTNDLE
ncbi:hypothetical protein SAMN04515691_2987 [Leifsonia sp. 98AMF]|uniref:hypothetical protein n=1 Tax=unclassified Leifsonia TaxID=2663824 RepID=UPI00087A9EC1|nr:MULTISPECIES: hypothetical protein [unclassified Leifsonia]SDH16127.1 hypothetical protein SAMN04515690_1029 [Leifsonia sp. 197AMF]SDJ22156.1 hypothetical protein SAMN04515684_2753 [Leifsonia sp. 466MF]SDK61583.1 hypothetical protein SAMN04515683_4011 [Leifsonia sp. 157MF]SDN43844.1 hypothetical protein SAMN04515686_0937 [Leifsonia sp. 509MF]SEN67256.1 hypothetical protein SAMN04515685_3992 [Leifsonia sp. 467MF]